MLEVKDKVQRTGLNKWVKAGRVGTLAYATGVGKTRCGVLAASYYARASNYDYKILIITPTETIRDTAWHDEFRKWSSYDVYKKSVEVMCIQSAYKLRNKHYNLVICDEIHNFLGPEYIKFFENNTYDSLLGLSATVSAYEELLLTDICPVVDSITTQKALELGLVSPFNIFNLGVILSPEERTRYDYIDGRINHIKSFGKNVPKRMLSERADIIYNAKYKIEVAAKIVDQAGDQYGVIFANNISFVNKLRQKLGDKCVVYHSKMTPKQKEQALARFSDGRTKVRVIIAPKALDEGVNLPRVTYGIICAGYSKERQTVQRLGRIIRLERDKKATLVRLFAKGTRDESWTKSSQAGYNSSYISSLTEIDW